MVSLFNMLCAQQHQWVVMRHAAFFFFSTKKIWRACLNSKRQWLVSIHLLQLPQIEHQPFGWVKHFIGGECSTFYRKKKHEFLSRTTTADTDQIRHNTQEERKGIYCISQQICHTKTSIHKKNAVVLLTRARLKFSDLWRKWKLRNYKS